MKALKNTLTGIVIVVGIIVCIAVPPIGFAAIMLWGAYAVGKKVWEK